VSNVVDTLEVRAADGWEGVFTAKPKLYADGDSIRYALRVEVDSLCYRADGWMEFTGDTVVIDIHRALDMDFYVYMVWDDAGHESERPESASFHLIDSEGKLLETITLTSADVSHTAWGLLGGLYSATSSGLASNVTATGADRSRSPE
jgi:hypothetical protein